MNSVSAAGDCFIILPELTEEKCTIYGRNSLLYGVQEILYFPKGDSSPSRIVKVNLHNLFL